MLAQLDMLADLANGKFKRQKDATKCNNNHHDTQGIERIQMAHQEQLMTSRFTRLSGRDETSCKFSSRAKSLWNLRQSPRCGPTTSYDLPLPTTTFHGTRIRHRLTQTTQPWSCKYSILPFWVKWSKWRLTFRNLSCGSVLCRFSEDYTWNLNVLNDLKWIQMISKGGNSGNLLESEKLANSTSVTWTWNLRATRRMKRCSLKKVEIEPTVNLTGRSRNLWLGLIEPGGCKISINMYKR